MNQALIIAQALLLGAVIFAAEGLRRGPRGYVDFLRATSALYFICFVVVPIYLQFDGLEELRRGAWGWLLKNPLHDDGFVYAGSLAFIGYGSLLLGYHLAGGFRPRPDPAPTSSDAWRPGRGRGEVTLVAMTLGMAGLACLLVYTQSIGGLGPLILQAAAFRGPTPPVVTPYAFLKTLSPMVMAGAFLVFGLRQRETQAGRGRRYTGVFLVFLAASLMVLFHQAGRFPLAAFLLTFPLAQVIRTERIRPGAAVLAVVAVFGLLLFGKQVFESTLTSTPLARRWELIGDDLSGGVRLIVAEFAFPVVTVANATLEVPDVVPFRWFGDFPLAVLYLVPQRLLGIAHPPTVSIINTELFGTTGTVPIDVISLGYFSAGVAGVMALMLVFGMLLVLLERMLPANSDPVECILRAAWILFISLRVMYGDPQLVWSGGLHLVTAGLLLVFARLLLEGARPGQPVPGPETAAEPPPMRRPG